MTVRIVCLASILIWMVRFNTNEISHCYWYCIHPIRYFHNSFFLLFLLLCRNIFDSYSDLFDIYLIESISIFIANDMIFHYLQKHSVLGWLNRTQYFSYSKYQNSMEYLLIIVKILVVSHSVTNESKST